jgi:hypothetical protein
MVLLEHWASGLMMEYHGWNTTDSQAQAVWLEYWVSSHQ